MKSVSFGEITDCPAKIIIFITLVGVYSRLHGDQ